MTQSLISIIVPVYNAEKYIDRCLHSIIDENPTEIEVIVVDDGSVDSSLEICQKYARRYSYISVIHKKNEGVSSARNDGMLVASGEYILFLDVDDWLEKGWYSTIREAIDKSSEDFIILGYRVCFENDKKNYIVSPFMDGIVKKEQFYEVLASSTYMNFCWGKLIRKEFIQRERIMFRVDKKIGEDVEFQVEILNRDPRICFFDKVIVNYFQNPTSVMHKFDTSKFMFLEEDYYSRKKFLENTEGDNIVEEKMYRDLGRILISYVVKTCKFETREKCISILNEISQKEFFVDIIDNVTFNAKQKYKYILVWLIERKQWSWICFLFGRKNNV